MVQQIFKSKQPSLQTATFVMINKPVITIILLSLDIKNNLMPTSPCNTVRQIIGHIFIILSEPCGLSSFFFRLSYSDMFPGGRLRDVWRSSGNWENVRLTEN